jgi:uncharacterized BrkB/YihY/UPF0761 family membrane protein
MSKTGVRDQIGKDHIFPSVDAAVQSFLSPGVIAALIWEAGQQIFTWYVGNIANYSLIYGSGGSHYCFLALVLSQRPDHPAGG